MSLPTEGSERSSANYDIICVGFSIEGLALAVSLADRKTQHKILFIDRNAGFKAGLGFHNTEDHAGSLFLKDLITLQNPKSEFTFINYLHESRLLIGFTNVSQMKPSRVLLENYLRWAAKKIHALGWVSFQSEAITVNPIRSNSTKSFDSWELRVRDNGTGRIELLQTQRLMVTTRAPKSISSIMQGASLRENVLLMHQFEKSQKAIEQTQRPLNIAVLGSSQQAVECFQEIVSGQGDNRACMIFPGSALRVEDSTPL
jgi:L-ornithine N5-oxygenase